MANFIVDVVAISYIILELAFSAITIKYLLFPINWNIIDFNNIQCCQFPKYDCIFMYSPIILFNSFMFNLIMRDIKKISINNNIVNKLNKLFLFVYYILAIHEIINLLITIVIFVMNYSIYNDLSQILIFIIHLGLILTHVSIDVI